MPLDPTISLQQPTTQMDLGGAALKGLNMQAAAMKPAMMQAQMDQMAVQNKLTQAQTANTQAQNPGVIADASSKVRQLAASKWFGANGSDYVTKNPNGNTDIDYPALMKDAAANGYGDLVPEFAKHFLDSASQQISNATSQQQLNDTKVKSVQSAAGIASQLVTNATDPDNPDLAVQQYQAARKQAINTLGADVANDNTFPDLTDATKVAAWAKANAGATMTPQEQANLKISQSGNVMALNNQQASGSAAFQLQNQEQNSANNANAALGKVDTIPEGIGGWAADKRAQWLLSGTGAEFAPVQQGIDEYNRINPGAHLDFNAPKNVIKDALKSVAAYHNAAAGGYAQQARTLGFNNAPAGTSAAPGNAAPVAPVASPPASAPQAPQQKPLSMGKVRFRDKASGRTGQITPSELAQHPEFEQVQ